MKKIGIVFLFFHAFAGTAQQGPVALPGPQGIFVYCGPVLARDFTYRVLRQEPGRAGWQPVGALRFPRNLEEFRGRLAAIALQQPLLHTPGREQQAFLWQALCHSRVTDSLYGWSANPLVLQAAGAGLWDNGAPAGKDCRYEVLQVDKTGKTISQKMTAEVHFPGQKPAFDIRPAGVKTTENKVELDFRLNRYAGLAGCRLYRQYYHQGPFVEIPATPVFFTRDHLSYLAVTDSSAATGIPYRYFIVPFDETGNEGKTSDTLNVYDITQKSNNAFVTEIHAQSDTAHHAIILHWHLTHPKEALSVDLYRGTSYDSTYQRVTSLSPRDSLFADHSVRPVITYFYTIVVNGIYGRSMPSARVPALLAADWGNHLPPQDISGQVDGTVVTLQWKPLQAGTRAYYVYRAAGFSEKPRLIARIPPSGDSIESFTDSLDLLPYAPAYRYAVRSENSSYALGPFSEMVTINHPRPLKLAVPARTMARYEAGKVRLVWDNVPAADAPGGFCIERRTVDAKGHLAEDFRALITGTAPGVNYFTDSSVAEGMEYLYRVRSVGFSNSQLGAAGLPASVFIPADLPAPPAHVRAILTGQGVALQWDRSLDATIQHYKIYRALQGGPPETLILLPAAAGSWTDSSAKPGRTYYYSIVSVNGKNKESPAGQPVGIYTGGR